MAWTHGSAQAARIYFSPSYDPDVIFFPMTARMTKDTSEPIFTWGLKLNTDLIILKKIQSELDATLGRHFLQLYTIRRCAHTQHTRPLKVCCGIWLQNIGSSFEVGPLWTGVNPHSCNSADGLTQQYKLTQILMLAHFFSPNTATNVHLLPNPSQVPW